MVLVCGEDGTRGRAIWNTEGLFYRGTVPGERISTGPARAEPGVHQLEEIPCAAAAQTEVEEEAI